MELMNSFDVNSLLALLEHGTRPRLIVDTLLQASRELRLPVQIDRRLRELTSSDLEPGEVVRQFASFIRGLSR